jgi:predicted PurR-regulated permease PerM
MTSEPRPPAPRSVPELLRFIWAQPWVRLLAYLLLLWLASRFARQISGVIVTGVVAFALAYLVNPALVWLERRKVVRVVGVLLLVLVFSVVAGLLVWAGVAQLGNLLTDVPRFVRQLGTLATDLLKRLSGLPGLENAPKQLNTAINAQVADLSQNALPFLQRLLSSGGTLLGGASLFVGWLGQAAFAVTLALYFMLDYPRLGPSVLRLFPVGWQPGLVRLSDDVADSFGGYVRGQLIIGLAAGVLVTLSLLLLGIPNALGLGLLMAALNIVPYIGLVIAAIPALLLAIAGGWVKVLLVVAVYFVTNQIIGNFLGPYVMGRTSNLSPAAVLLSLLIGLSLYGLIGGLLAVPTATLIKHWLEVYWLPSRLHGQGAVPEVEER